MSLKVGILGCGLIGVRRAEIIRQTGLGTVTQYFDPSVDPKIEGATKAVSAEALLQSDVDIVVVATPNRFLAPYGQEALKNGKHTILEKPGAISLDEVKGLCRTQKESGKVCKIGYDHRFHPAALAINEALKENPEPLHWVRMAYGHGGRNGYEKEWRFDAKMSGGGELIDQGVHLLDMLQWWFPNQFSLEGMVRQNAFYRAEVEDNGFLSLVSDQGAVAQLHCSVTQWKNIFRIEVGTRSRLLVWEGLGNKNYGPETLTVHVRPPEGGRPETSQKVFEADEGSWVREWRHFYEGIQGETSSVYSPPEESLWIFEVLSRMNANTLLSVSES